MKTKRVYLKGERHPSFKWTVDLLKAEALKYKTRSEFKKTSLGAYLSAYRRDLLDSICGHMIKKDTSGENHYDFKWTLDLLQAEALKYQTRSEFRGRSSAYQAAHSRGLLDSVCGHMERLHQEWTIDSLQAEALKYQSRNEFASGSSAR